MSAATGSSAVGASAEMATLLNDIAKQKTRVDKAEAALERAEARDPAGTGSEVSACRQILIGAQTILHDLYEKEKRLTAGTAGE